jgi:hypothetical protein
MNFSIFSPPTLLCQHTNCKTPAFPSPLGKRNFGTTTPSIRQRALADDLDAADCVWYRVQQVGPGPWASRSH